MKLRRRRLLKLAAGAALLPAMPYVARAQVYPARPVRLLIGLPAGGTIDVIGRIVGQWLSEHMGQPFVIENKVGAGGNLGAEALVNAAPDGYTLFVATAANAVNATLFEKLSYDFVNDVAPIGPLSRIPNVLEVTPSFAAKTVPELIAMAKSKPLTIATPSTGTPPFMAAELFKMMAGVNIVHVPYRAEAQMVSDVMGGQVQVAFGGISASMGQIKAQTLRAIAIGTAERLKELPDLPTVAESVPGFEAVGWCGMVAPKKTPAEIIDKMHGAITAALDDQKTRQRFADLGVSGFTQSPADFGTFIADETVKWGKVVKFAGLKPE